MTSPLYPCSQCQRHIRTHHTECPFCGTTNETPQETHTPSKRFSRAVLVAMGALSMTACGSQNSQTDTQTVQTQPVGNTGTGGTGTETNPNQQTASADASAPANPQPNPTPNPGQMVARYGLPPRPLTEQELQKLYEKQFIDSSIV